jgi:hypothetical protein
VGCQNGPNNVANLTLIPVQSDVYLSGLDFVDNEGDYDEGWPLKVIKLID